MQSGSKKPAAMKPYSVVIRCCNEEKHVARLLAGILEQSIKPEEIIVVDSGSTDATLYIVSRFPAKIVSIEKEKFSFGRALNIGCSHSRSPFIIFASAHVYPVYKNWAELLLAAFDDERTGLVYGKQRGDENSRYFEHQIWKHWFPDGLQGKQSHPFCNNANAAIRRRLWEQFPYSEEIVGLEDLAWAKKITEAKYNIVYQAAAEVVHIHSESLREVFNRFYREALALKSIYPEEQFRKREFIYLLVSNIFSDLLHAFKDGVMIENFKDIVLFRLMQFAGTYKGFHKNKLKASELKERFYYPRGAKHIKDNDASNPELMINYSRIYEKNKV